MNNAVREISKSWLAPWLDSLRGLTPVEQVIGLWLVAQADDGGNVGTVDWAKLAYDGNVSVHTAKRRLLDGQLIERGLVLREARREGGARLPTLFRLNVNCTHNSGGE